MTPADIQRAFEERQQAAHALRDLATEAEEREFTAKEIGRASCRERV